MSNNHVLTIFVNRSDYCLVYHYGSNKNIHSQRLNTILEAVEAEYNRVLHSGDLVKIIKGNKCIVCTVHDVVSNHPRICFTLSGYYRLELQDHTTRLFEDWKDAVRYLVRNGYKGIYTHYVAGFLEDSTTASDFIF